MKDYEIYMVVLVISALGTIISAVTTPSQNELDMGKSSNSNLIIMVFFIIVFIISFIGLSLTSRL